jgi:hypothetical protein
LAATEKRGRLGRRLAIGIYTVGLVYLVVVGFASVIPQVFWPKDDGDTTTPCDQALRSAHQQIEEIRNAYLSGRKSDLKELQEGLKPWDERMASLRKRCDIETIQLLERYRHRVELNLRRYLREERGLANEVEQAVAPSAGRSQ